MYTHTDSFHFIPWVEWCYLKDYKDKRFNIFLQLGITFLMLCAYKILAWRGNKRTHYHHMFIRLWKIGLWDYLNSSNLLKEF